MRTASLYHPFVKYDDDFPSVSQTVRSKVAGTKPPYFRTNAGDLFSIYLSGFSRDRQTYNCHACRRFLEQYGSLVTIDDP